MEFIDTHSHIYDTAFDADCEAVIGRAVKAGVGRMVLPDIDASTRTQMFALAERHEGVLYPCLGLHPTSVDATWKEELEKVEDMFGRTRIFAVGEIGLDFYWSKEFIKEQEIVFTRLLEAASAHSLPVIIHAREATEAIFGVLKRNRHLDLRGVFHAYSGSLETYREIERLGDWYVGIGGVLTFKKASIAETVRDIPLERIILETDAPYLTPAPHRGTRNESSYIPLIAEKLAMQKGTDIEEIAEVTTGNAIKLFNL